MNLAILGIRARQKKLIKNNVYLPGGRIASEVAERVLEPVVDLVQG